MEYKFYEVVIVTTKTVTVKVPLDDPKMFIHPDEDPAEIAEEFALEERKEFVLATDTDWDVESVTEIDEPK